LTAVKSVEVQRSIMAQETSANGNDDNPVLRMSSPVPMTEQTAQKINMRTSGIYTGSDEVMDGGDDEGGLKIHEKQIEDVIAELISDPVNGLTSAEAKKRFDQYGPNELEQPPRISLLMLFIVQLNSVIMYLLIAAVIASAAIKATGKNSASVLSYIDSIAIMIIVLINATIAAVTENNANDALAALSSLQSPMSKVIRDGKEDNIDSRLLVPGDIVKVETGDVVPADLRCIKASDLRVNEMLLTGEPEDVAKNDKVKPPPAPVPEGQEKPAEKLTADNMAFSSCQVKAGDATTIVTSTGMNTRVGSIAKLLNEKGGKELVDEKGNPREKNFEEISANCFGMLPDTKTGQSPLQANLEMLAIKIGYIAIFVCTVVFFVGLAMDTKDPEDPETESWLFMILVAVTLTVAAIPEGLPLCVTIALSSGCTTMVTKNVLVRKLAAVETLGSASIICTDKTGTLTEGKMTLVAMYTGCTEYTVTGKGFDPEIGEITANTDNTNGKDSDAVKNTLGSAVLCSKTTLAKEMDEDSGTMKWTPRGNSSEAPLVVAAQKIGITKAQLDTVQKDIYQIPFSSSRKMMLTVTQTLGEGLNHLDATDSYTCHVKGAPNYIMDKCTKYIAADGSVQSLTKEIRDMYNTKVDELSDRALRVLAVASKPLGSSLPYYEEDETDAKFAKMATDLTLCGMCASIDPERDGVKDAVKTARTAGCRVVMITGDYEKTAIAIAKNINIITPSMDVKVMATDCKHLRPNEKGDYLPNAEFDKFTMKTCVFARAKPEDKLEIVKSLQRQGFVCAMTGDGVNDAPALQKADIGVAMGLEGTEVAKGASDMVLTDDNFCSIVDAIEQGRIIYAGIQKFVSFIMSVHFAEVMQIFLCIVSSVPVMRQPLQILFLILVTDLPPSIALGFEPGEPQTMKRKPRPKTQPIVLMSMWGGIVAHGMILTACIFSTYMVCLWAYAGAFLSDDIIDEKRTRCAIWDSDGSWGPTLTKDCGMYVGGNGTVTGTWQSYGSDACNICVDESIRRARTAAFISLVWAEGLRAYVSRSFENPFWMDMFGNPSMNKAVGLAQLTLALALFLPWFSTEVLGLYVYEIQWFGWFFAAMGSLACLFFCEVFKFFAAQYVEHSELAGYEEGEDGEEVSVHVDSGEGTEVPMEDMSKDSRMCGAVTNAPGDAVDSVAKASRDCC